MNSLYFGRMCGNKAIVNVQILHRRDIPSVRVAAFSSNRDPLFRHHGNSVLITAH